MTGEQADQAALPQCLRPGMFSVVAHADSRRGEYDAKNEQLLAAGTSIDAVFIGDSITQNWDLGAWFSRALPVSVNRGIGGDSALFLARRFAADALQLKPARIVLLAGINDTWVLDDPLHPAHLRPDLVQEALRSRMLPIMQASVDAGIPLYVCSLLPTSIPGNPNNDMRNELVRAWNNELSAFIRERSDVQGDRLYYVDYHAELVQEDGLTLKAGVAHDGLHPHALGYKMMAQSLLEMLE